MTPVASLQRVQMVELYRIRVENGSPPGLEWVTDVEAPALPQGYARAVADRLAVQALSGVAELRSIETLESSGDFLRAAALIRARNGAPSEVVVTTDYLTGELVFRSRRMTQAFENYNQLRVLKRPLTGVLKDEGYAVEAVPSGEVCLDRVTRGGVDLIVLDVWLPGIDGLATLARLRERKVDSQVVLISGQGNIESAVRAIRMGGSISSKSPCCSTRQCSSSTTPCVSAGWKRRTARCVRALTACRR